MSWGTIFLVGGSLPFILFLPASFPNSAGQYPDFSTTPQKPGSITGKPDHFIHSHGNWLK